MTDSDNKVFYTIWKKRQRDLFSVAFYFNVCGLPAPILSVGAEKQSVGAKRL